MFAREPALTKEMVEAMIKEVRIYQDDRYEIKWKFRNMFDEWLAREDRSFLELGGDGRRIVENMVKLVEKRNYVGETNAKFIHIESSYKEF